MTNRRNIKIKPEAFEELKDQKPEGVSWGYYLTEMRTVDNDN